jgi:hypothetical protein
LQGHSWTAEYFFGLGRVQRVAGGGLLVVDVVVVSRTLKKPDYSLVVRVITCQKPV